MHTHLELLRSIAEKPLSHNPDINQHIVSCRLSLAIINEQNTVIQALEDKINLSNNKDKIINTQQKLIDECYRIIAELFNT